MPNKPQPPMDLYGRSQEFEITSRSEPQDECIILDRQVFGKIILRQLEESIEMKLKIMKKRLR